ncbi:hypothetical protein [Alkalihalobacterium sp. APHAB7]|uniref:hypothetical protein n=1 Tax=Alkalihalobacterium sp. APHAB7 TaxID=3402081 RepID=UPI003AAF8A3D
MFKEMNNTELTKTNGGAIFIPILAGAAAKKVLVGAGATALIGGGVALGFYNGKKDKDLDYR